MCCGGADHSSCDADEGGYCCDREAVLSGPAVPAVPPPPAAAVRYCSSLTLGEKRVMSMRARGPESKDSSTRGGRRWGMVWFEDASEVVVLCLL